MKKLEPQMDTDGRRSDFLEKLLDRAKVEWKALGDVFTMRAGQHISASRIKENDDGGYLYPRFGGNGGRGFVKDKSHEGDYLLIGRQGALCGNVQRMKGQFNAAEHAAVVTAGTRA